MLRSLNAQELNELVQGLLRPSALVELAILIGCLLAAWVVVRLVRGERGDPDSVWFGRRIVDGVLFPVLALVFGFVVKLLLGGIIKPAIFKIAVPILFSLVVIRLSVRVLRASFPATSWVRTAERSISWIAWIAVALWILGVLPLILDAMGDVRWDVGSTHLSLRNVFEGTLTAGLALVVALWISGAIERRLLRGTPRDLSLRKMLANVVRVVLLFVGLLVGLSAVGIDLTALSVVGGAIGVGLGFGLQKIAANYVSGFVILAERSLRIGDMVKIDTVEGRITDIRTRYTIIRSLGGRESIVPNEMLITNRVENASLADPRVAISSGVQVAYGTDVPALQPVLVEAMLRVPRVLSEPGPSVQLGDFASDGMNLVLNFWIRDPENGLGNVKSDVNLAVLAVLNARGIEIPYPQRVVHARISREKRDEADLLGPVPSIGEPPPVAATREPRG